MTLAELESKIRDLRSLQKEAETMIEGYAREIRKNVLWRETRAKSFQDYLKVHCGFSHFEVRALLSSIGAILTANQLVSEDPLVQERIDLLRDWRRRRAKEAGFAPFRIFSNRTLLAIANEDPQDCEDLLGIAGLGRKKVESFGADLLLALQRDSVPTSSRSAPSPVSTPLVVQ